ncbi:hypothetical protein TPA0906_65800 [Streptomyces olivaceus]|nr:hypothetical protein TPA0906_65800 [Streptomyces olivaceus]
MNVRVLRVSEMPFNVDVWVDDRDDGTFVIYIDRDLITERGAGALQQLLGTTIAGWRRLDDSHVYATLRAVTG